MSPNPRRRTMSVDLYEILGLDSDADRADIKAAYHRLAMKYHPDQNPGDREAEERFKEVTHAYEVLSDPARRRAYDRLHKRGGPTGGAPFDNFGDLFDVLNSVISAGFSGLSRSARGRKGKDIRAELTVTLEEAMSGVRRDVTVPRPRECSQCGGSGAEPGTRLARCDECGGEGKVQVQQGFFSLMRDCPECLGKGRIVESPCQRCQGEGDIQGTELLPIDVPAGVRDGQTLRWSGKGAAGGNGESGDLLVDIHVEEHSVFERDGQDIHLSFPISFTQASLGAKIEVPTLDGQVRMKVPSGTESGRVFRLRGKGLPPIGDRPQGDQYVRLEVKSPEQLSKHQEQLRGQFDSKQNGDGASERGLWGRVRDFFE